MQKLTFSKANVEIIEKDFHISRFNIDTLLILNIVGGGSKFLKETKDDFILIFSKLSATNPFHFYPNFRQCRMT